MARSISKPSGEPSGSFHAERSGAKASVYWRDGSLHHRIEVKGLVADYPIDYAIGSGAVGRSYLVQIGGHLFQSPASFYVREKKWGLTPGYENEPTPDFTQPATRDCIFCHANSDGMTADKRFFRENSLQSISCERCHGQGEAHRKQPSRANIVNPARLAARERDSVCEQCHLKGAAAVLHEGKDWWDFRPGEALETIATYFVEGPAGAGQSIPAVSHPEQLALSACARKSNGKLWCGSCHDPHGAPAADRRAQVAAICAGCHAPAQLAATHQQIRTDCVSCHMPSRPASDVAHAAVTDHRILARPATRPAKGGELAVWHEPGAKYAARDQALAQFSAAEKSPTPAALRQAFLGLAALPQRDAVVDAALGYLSLQGGKAQAATALFREATNLDSGNAEYWLDLGVAEEAAGDEKDAIASLEKCISLDRYDYRPYRALAQAYSTAHLRGKGKAVVESFLLLNPQSIVMRAQAD